MPSIIFSITTVDVCAFVHDRSNESPDGVGLACLSLKTCVLFVLYYLSVLLFVQLLYRDSIMKHGVRVRVLEDHSLLPKDVLEQVARVVMMSRDNKNAFLNVCFAYSSQHEITEAVKRMATGVEEGLLQPRCV